MSLLGIGKPLGTPRVIREKDTSLLIVIMEIGPVKTFVKIKEVV